MGIRNSSRTRVEPVFHALMDRDPSGCSWLLQLLQMGSRAPGRLETRPIGSLRIGHPRWWGDNERRLDPPKALLEWLVRNVKAPSSKALWGGTETRAKRERLVAGDPETLAEALRLLEGPYQSRKWYILEGRSQPDVYLETESLILVIEGKRTEREATASITWMQQRSQMLRHMDAACEVRLGKRVLGLMITEGPGGAEATAPSDYWLHQAALQVRDDTLTTSLPHRSQAERQEIAEGFLGVTTWQRLCVDFGLPWPPAEDSVREAPAGTSNRSVNLNRDEHSSSKMGDGMRRSKLTAKDFPTKQEIIGFEGGAVFVAEGEGKCYLIEDEGTLADLLNPEDVEGLEFVRVYEFDSKSDRERYLRRRGWLRAEGSPKA